MTAHPKIVIIDHHLGVSDDEEQILRPLSPKYVVSTPIKDEEEVISLIHNADAVLNAAVSIDRGIINQMKNCKIIANYGSGTADAVRASEKGIHVADLCDHAPQENAEHILALAFALRHRVLAVDSWVRNGRSGNLPTPISGFLHGMKFGIYGFTKAANDLSKKAKSLGLDVLFCGNGRMPRSSNLRFVDVDTLLKESDFFSVHQKTVEEFGEGEFRKMKPGSIFIHSTGHGLKMDYDALALAISEERISGAALNVQNGSRENLCKELLKSDRVIFTSHPKENSGYLFRELRKQAAAEVFRFLSKKKPSRRVKIADKQNHSTIETPKESGVKNGSLSHSSNGNHSRKKQITTAEFIVRYLESLNVQQIFGVSGGTISPIYEAMKNSRIKDILTKHEAGAAFMADSYARVSGKLGVCMATTGPGATNLLTGVASAFADSIPILVLTGQVSTEYFGKGASQESSPESVDIVQIFKQVTRYSGLVHRASRVPDFLRKAITHALHGRCGPVHLSLPNDILREEIEDTPDIWEQPNRPAALFDKKTVRAAAAYLIRARRPAILVGHGCMLADAFEEVRQLVELLKIPAATTPKAKGALPEDHILSLGVFGFSGSPLAEQYLLSGEVDVLMGIGTSFNEWGTQGWKKELMPTQVLIHMNIDPREVGRNFPAKISLCGDAKTVLGELISEIKNQRTWLDLDDRCAPDELAQIRTNVGTVRNPSSMGSKSIPLKPQRLMADLRASLPADVIVFADGGANRSWATHYFKVLSPRSFFSATGMASMGYGMAGAVGAKFAVPDKIVVAIVGDGGFLMNGMEVATAVAYEKQVIWVVLNDGQYGMIYHGDRMSGYSGISTQYPTCDVSTIAQGLGAHALSICKPGEITQRLIRDIIATGRPTVLDVRIDPEEPPPIGARVSSIKMGLAAKEQE